MVDPHPLAAEDFTIRRPLFLGGVVLFGLGTLGGFIIDSLSGFTTAAVLDLLTLGVLGLVVLLVRWQRLSLPQAVATFLYLGAGNFLFAIGWDLATRSPLLDVQVYNNLFILSLIMAVATFLVGRSATVVFGSVFLGTLLVAAFFWTENSIRGNLWFEIPSVLGTTIILYRYRSSLDRLLADQRRAIRENKLLRDRERLAALGELTAGISHEIRNPLNLVVNFAESSSQLLDDLEASWALESPTASDLEERAYLMAELRQNMADVRTQGLRGVEIVQSMLLHARADGGGTQVLDLNDLARECLSLAWLGFPSEAPGTVQRHVDGTPEPVWVRVSRNDLSRAIVNLCSNAFWSAIERKRRAPASDAVVPSVVVSVRALNQEAVLEVRDNGLGFDAGVEAKLFTPFFTTKPPGAGTGLGLALTHEVVVDQHGGRMEVKGTPGLGARFTVILPRETGSDHP